MTQPDPALPDAGADPPEGGRVASGEKPRRKNQAKAESARGYRRTDSTDTLLDAVEPKYREAALAVLESPRTFNGQLVWLVDSPLNPLPNAYQPGDLKKAGRLGFLTFFEKERKDGSLRLYCIIYIRVSTRGQALKGKALTATLTWMLRKCARHGLSVAGIAVDVDSGQEEDRMALGLIMQAIQQGGVRCLVVPAISRLERSEAHFGMRMERLAAAESWVYYGHTYEDPNFEYVSWNDFDSRDRAVVQVRAAEKYVQDGIDGVTSTDRQKLIDGFLVSSNKRDTFCIYDLEIQDADRPMAKRKIIRPTNAREVYEGIKAAIFKAAEEGDEEALNRIAEEQSQRTGKPIKPADLWWELAVGWPINLNRRSPHAEDGLAEECKDDIGVEDDLDAYWRLLEAFDDLEALVRRARHKTVLASDTLDAVRKMKVGEAQEERGDDVRFILACLAKGHDPVPVKWLGDVPGDSRYPQDWVICPICDKGVSGKDGKRMLPQKTDYRRADAAPDEPCSRCGHYLPLVDEMTIRVGAVEWKIYRCTACSKAPPQLGAPIVSEPIQPLEPKGEAKRRKRSRDEPWDGIQRPSLPPPEEAPAGLPPLYKGPVPTGTNYFDQESLKPAPMAARLMEFLMKNRGCSFTTDQLKAVGLGGQNQAGAPLMLRTRYNKGYNTVKAWLAKKGLVLRTKQRLGGRMHFLWLEEVGDAPEATAIDSREGLPEAEAATSASADSTSNAPSGAA